MATTKIIGKVSIIPCGTYVDGTTYTRLSVVNYQGGSYIALVDNTNIVPTNDSVWYLLTAPGRGIQQIEKIGTVGLVDTYRITYTDGTHFDYTVNNGASKTSELNNDAGFITNQVNDLANYLLAVDTGAYIELLYDSESYTITANLKNSSNTIISTSTAQLPLGGNYVSSSYNDGVITLTKLNGTSDTIELSDLVKKSTTIAGLDLGNDITTQELIEALDVYTIPEINSNFVSQSIIGKNIYLEDSSNLTFKNFKLLGDTTQNLYTGKNLLDSTQAIEYGIAPDRQEIYYVAGRNAFLIPVDASTTYTFSRSAVGTASYSYWATLESFTLGEVNTCIDYGNFANNSSVSITTTTNTNYIMLFFGTGVSTNMQLEKRKFGYFI